MTGKVRSGNPKTKIISQRESAEIAMQATPEPAKKVRRRRQELSLEPRIMFDAAAVATAADALTLAAAQQVTEPQQNHAADAASALPDIDSKAAPAHHPVASPPSADPAAPSFAGTPTAPLATNVSVDPTTDRKEVAFIDTSVTDWQILRAGVKDGVDIVLLDGSQDGLTQMAAWAEGKSGYSAIHVLSHGAEGQITLGTLTLDFSTTQARSADLAALGSVLTTDGDLLLYGCNVASGEGEAFLAAMADLTDADVAASDDLTGAAILGGDWALEHRSGAVEADEIAVAAYAEALTADAPTLDTANSVPADGATAVSVSADIVLDFNEPIAFGASGKITLYNLTSRLNTAVFDVSTAVGGTITLSDGSTLTLSGDKITINPNGVLASASQYTVLFTAGSITDQESIPNPIAAITDGNDYSFTTGIRVLFNGFSNVVGSEIFYTDGTTAGTGLLKDIYAGGTNSSNAQAFAFLPNGKMLFSADDGTNGAELWITDGTEAGTVLVKDINSGSVGSNPGWITVLSDGRILFSTVDATNGNELWITDGTAAGTSLLKDINPGTAGASLTSFLALNNGKMLFVANDGTNGSELWITDGTADGTTLLKDIASGSTGSSVSKLTKLANGSVLFSANDGTNGAELWITDGTANGTVLLKDINTSANAGSNITAFVVLPNGKALFGASDGSTNSGNELWITDGTANGTVLLKDIAAGTANSSPQNFALLPNGKVLFSASTNEDGTELWVTDGTADGTVLVKNINTNGTSGSSPSKITVMPNGKAVFAATTSGDGNELWVTDGTADGTSLLKDIRSGSSGSSSATFTLLADGKVMFVANNNLVGAEPWITDGTTAGTYLLKDINDSGTLGSTPTYITSFQPLPVNQLPVIGNLAGDTVVMRPSDGPTVIDQGTAASATDTDTTVFTDGTLTVAITTGRDDGADSLAVRNQGTSAGQIGVSGSTITYGGTTIGSFAGGTGSSDLVISFNSNATHAAVSALLQNITFGTSSNNSSARIVGFTLADGMGATSATASATITVNANTAPDAGGAVTVTDIAGSAVSVAEDATPTSANIRLTPTTNNDTEDGAGAITRVRILSVTGGTLTQADGTSISLGAAGTLLTLSSGSVDLRFTPTANRDTDASFEYVMVDNAATNSAASTATISITAANDAPTVSGTPTVTITEDTAYSFTTGDFNFNDVDTGDTLASVTIATLPSVGTLWLDNATSADNTYSSADDTLVTAGMQISAADITRLRYQPAQDGNGTAYASFTYRVNDGAANSSTATMTIDVTAVNDAPVLNNLNATTVAVGVSAGPVVLNPAANASVTDVDAVPLNTGTLTVAFTANAVTVEDVLGIRHQGNGTGQIGVSGSDVSYEGTVIGSFAGGSTGNNLVITFNDHATLTAVSALLRNITYDNVNNANPSTTSRSVGFTLTDGQGGTSALSTVTVHFNQPPTLNDLHGDGKPATTSANSVAFLDSFGGADVAATVSDPENDSAGWANATLTVQRSGTAGTANGAWAADILGLQGLSYFSIDAGNGATTGVFGNSSGRLITGTPATEFGTFTIEDGVLSVTFNAAATSSLVGRVINGLTHYNTTPAGNADFTVSLNDGAGNIAIATTALTSNTITVTNATDSSTIDVTDGVSFSEAIAIAAEMGGNQTIAFSSALAGQTVNVNGTVSIAENMLVDFSGANGVTLSGGALSVGSGSTIQFHTDTSVAATIQTWLEGAGVVEKTGAGNITLSGTNTRSGATTITAGTLTAGGADTLSDSSAITIASGATLALAGDETVGSITGAGDVALGSHTLTVGADGSTMSVAGTISGTGGLIKAGAGSLTLTGTSNSSGWSGALTVSAGTLSVGADSQLTSGRLVLAGGTLQVTGTDTGTTPIDNRIDVTAASTVDVADTLNLTGVLAGAGALTKVGAGTLTVGGSEANTISGNLIVNAGYLVAGKTGALGSSAITIADGASLHFTTAYSTTANVTVAGTGVDTNGAIRALGGNVTLNGVITLTGHTTISTNQANDVLTLSGTVTDGASSYKLTSKGNLTLSGVGAWNDGLLATDGTLLIDKASAVGAGKITLSNASLGNVGSDITLSQEIQIGTGGSDGGTITAATDTTFTVSGVISGSGALVKNGLGTLLSSGTNSFTGTTRVDAGTLSVAGTFNATGSGDVTVAAGTLAGTGTLNSKVIVASGATLAPGVVGRNSGIGTLTVKELTLQAGATLAMQINSAVNYDRLIVQGAADLGSATLALTGTYTPIRSATADSFTLVSRTDTTALTGTFNGLTGTATLGSVTLTATYTGGTDSNDFVLTGPVNAAPVLAGTFTTAGTVDDNATITPFSGVTVTDADDSTGTFTLRITYTGANGTLSSAGGGLTGGVGDYVLSASTPAALQTLLQALVFTPTASQVAAGNTVQTTFSLTASDGLSSGTANTSTVVTATSINNAPTAVALSDNFIPYAVEVTNYVVGTLSATDSDSTSFTYTLVSGDGDTDNAKFNINGTSLRANDTLEFGQGESYSVRVRVSDGSATYEQVLTIICNAELVVTTTTVTGDDASAGSFSNITEAVTAISTQASDGSGLSLIEATEIANYLLTSNLFDGAPIRIRFADTLAGTITLSSALTVSDNITLVMDSDTDARSLTITGSSLLLGANFGTKVGTGDSLTISTNLTDSGTSASTLTKSGGGTLVLGGTNNTTSTGLDYLRVEAGTLSVGAVTTLGLDTITLAGGTLSFSSIVTVTNNIVLEKDSTIHIADAITLSGNISGAGGFTKTGSGGLVLSPTGESTFTGKVVIAAGTVRATKNSAFGSSAGGIEVLSGAALNLTTVTIADDLTIGGSGAGGTGALLSTSATSSTLSGRVTLSSNLVMAVGSSTTITMSGLVTDNQNSYSLTLNSVGTVVLSGTGDFDGGLSVSAGKVTLQGGAAIKDTATVTLSSSGTLQLDASETIGGLDGASTISLGSNTLTVATAASTTYSGVIGGTGALIKAGLGTLTLSGNNTLTGGVTISSGTLVVNRSGGALPNQGAVSVAAGATLSFNFSDTVGAVSGAGTIILNAATLTSTVASGQPVEFSGVIKDGTGNGSITKTGAGIWTLSGNNSYSGVTTVQAGVLVVAHDNALGNTSGSTTVGSGAGLWISAGLTVAENISITGNGVQVTEGTKTYSSGAIRGYNPTNTTVSGSTLTGTVTLTGSATLYTDTGTSLTVANGIAQSGSTRGVTKGGAGTLVLAGDNLFTGALAMLGGGGTLVLSGSNSVTNVSAANSTKLVVNGTLAASGTFNVNETGILAGTGSITTATVTISGSASSASTLAPGDQADGSHVGTLTINGNLALNGTLAANFAGTVAGTGYDQVLVTGTVTLGADSLLDITTLNGYTPTNNDTFTLIDNTGSSAVSGTFKNLAQGSSLSIAGVSYFIGYAAGAGSNNVMLTVPPTITNLNGNTVSWAGVGQTVKLDAGANAIVSDLAAAQSNNGNGNWSGYSLTVKRQGTALAIDQFGVNADGLGFTVSGSNLLVGSNVFGTFTSANGVLTITFDDSDITPTTALVNDVIRAITYHNDTPTGDTTVSIQLTDGTNVALAEVVVESDTIFVTTSTAATTIDLSDGVSFGEAIAIAAADITGSQTIVIGTATVTGSDVTLSESLTLQFGDGGSLNTGTLTLDTGAVLSLKSSVNASATLSMVLGGTGSVRKSEAGSITLSGSNSYTGATSIFDGTLSIAGDGNIGTGGVTLDGGTLLVSSTTTIDNAIALGSGGGTINVSSGVSTLSGVISGTGALTKTGTGSLTIGGSDANSFSGAVTISAGTVTAAKDSAFGTSAGGVTIAADASLALSDGVTIADA
ncbi:ELWxxDGT repeat protein, partial [Azospirillum sp. RU38E]|uniref:ELWxxDGT repeat protein n=2 Tax=unclassified Azospirillum TaxID=2630922 RepID=UPI000B72833D